jgi:arginyl-tRNA--protein-N-Asp/Glu arginylyltransferase
MHRTHRRSSSRSAPTRFVLLGVFAALSASCAASDDCPSELPDDADCATAAPSYSSQVYPVFEEYCEVCHLPGNGRSSKVLTNYEQIVGAHMSIQALIHQCKMPIGPRRLTPENRTLLLKWFACGMPNN